MELVGPSTEAAAGRSPELKKIKNKRIKTTEKGRSKRLGGQIPGSELHIDRSIFDPFLTEILKKRKVL